MRFLLWVTVNALALAAATALLDGIRLTGATTEDKVVTLVLVAIIFGLVNAVVRPVVKLISFPFIILTLGPAGAGHQRADAAAHRLARRSSSTLGFRVDGFWTAVFGGIVIMVATWVLEAVLPERD